MMLEAPRSSTTRLRLLELPNPCFARTQCNSSLGALTCPYRVTRSRPRRTSRGRIERCSGEPAPDAHKSSGWRSGSVRCPSMSWHRDWRGARWRHCRSRPRGPRSSSGCTHLARRPRPQRVGCAVGPTGGFVAAAVALPAIVVVDRGGWTWPPFSCGDRGGAPHRWSRCGAAPSHA